MSAWLAQWPALLVAPAVLFLPGLAWGYALRLRGLALWALAPAASVATLTGAALILGLFGVGWSAPAAVAVCGVVAAVAVLVRVTTRTRGTAVPRPAGTALVAAGVAAGALLTLARLGLYIGAPDAISQTNDAAFHLNALRFAVETGAASPLQLTSMLGASTFYPSSWHVLASVVVPLSGADVEVAANVVSLAVACLAWPLGIAYLTRSIAGPGAAAVAAALSAAIPAFPLVLLQWGVLYPQLVAVALLPAAIAVVLDPALRGAGRWGLLRPALLGGVGLAAIALSQPSVLLAWIVAVYLWGLGEIVRRWRGMSTARRRAAIAALAAAAVLSAGVWFAFGRSIDGTWPTTSGVPAAALEVLANGFLGYPWAVGASILLVVGIVAAVREPACRWVVAVWAAFGVLYVVAAAIDLRPVRAFLVDPWYDDPYRIAALLPVVVLPLAGIGAAAVAGAVARRRGWQPAALQAAVLAVVVATGAGSLIVAPQIERRDVFADRVDPNLYRPTADSWLSADELELLERLDDTVPADAVVIGNPGTAMGFGYALSGRNVVPRTWSPPPGEAYDVLWQRLRDVASDDAVCPALDAFGARYVLDFGPGEEYPGRWVMPGFDRLAGQPGFELVDREGDARLWRVTACG